MSDAADLLRTEDFVSVLEQEAVRFPYSAFSNPKDVTEDHPFLDLPKTGALRFMPMKQHWHYSEFMSFEGEEFAYAVARALGRRQPSQGELYLAGAKNKPWARVDLMLQMYRKDRKSGSSVKLHGLGACQIAWNWSRKLEKSRLRFLRSLADSAFKSLAKRRVNASLADASTRMLLYKVLDRIEVLNKQQGGQ